jgi:N-methylhydantoinase A
LTPAQPSGRRNWGDFEKDRRKIYDRRSGEIRPCIVYQRPFVGLDDLAHGPCVIEQYDTTTVVDSGWAARSLGDGNLVLQKN